MRRALLVLLLPFAALACSRAGASAPAADGDVGQVHRVEMRVDGNQFLFEPERIEARRGDVVRFVQVGAVPHNVEFVRNEAPDGVDLGSRWVGPYVVGDGETYDVVVDETFVDGSYPYLCTPHAAMGMMGVIEVAGTAAAPAPEARAAADLEAADAGTAGLPVVRGQRGARELEAEVAGDGVRTFRMDVEKVQWETKEGKLVEAWTFDRQVPGPTIRAAEGELIRIVVTNRLPESTTTHWHGLEVPNAMDGVPGVSQEPIAPGDSFTYEFRAKPAGTHAYHSHFNSLHQEEHGLYGMMIVEPREELPQMAADREAIMILGDGPLGFVINGKEFPMTEPIRVTPGERVRVRMANLGGLYHPMHLHGSHFRVVAKDGFPLPAPRDMNTLSLAPGETFDVILEATEPGTWLWHCHVLSHVTGPKGPDGQPTVAGMVGIVEVDEPGS